VSPVEQNTIDCENLAYFEPKKYKRDIMQLFSADVFKTFFLPMKT
jgi:hypothetical protein